MSGARFPNVDEDTLQQLGKGCGDGIAKMLLLAALIGGIICIGLWELGKFLIEKFW